MSVRGNLIAAVAASALWGGAAVAQGLDAPVAETLGAWPCLDSPGCGGMVPAPRIIEATAPDLAALAPPDPSAIPLPTALALFGAGLATLALFARRR